MHKVLFTVTAIVPLALMPLAVGASAPAPRAAGHSATSWWKPGPSTMRWQWELDHPLKLTSRSDMGTNSTLPNGSPAQAPSVYDIDGIINPKSTVAALHARRDKVICYVEVGAAGNYYSTTEEHVATTYYSQLAAAGVLGKKVPDYPERFVNIASATTTPIIESMIDQQCAAKGFDAVETDLDETYSGTDGSTGFTLTQSDEVRFMKTLSTYMHSLGLGWIAKNPDDTGDNYATLIEPFADGVLSEQCNEYHTCSALHAFIGHKAIFNAEYNLSPSAYCASDIASDINGVRFSVNLDGSLRRPCQ